MNRRPPAPKAGALPGCATPRLSGRARSPVDIILKVLAYGLSTMSCLQSPSGRRLRRRGYGHEDGVAPRRTHRRVGTDMGLCALSGFSRCSGGTGVAAPGPAPRALSGGHRQDGHAGPPVQYTLAGPSLVRRLLERAGNTQFYMSLRADPWLVQVDFSAVVFANRGIEVLSCRPRQTRLCPPRSAACRSTQDPCR